VGNRNGLGIGEGCEILVLSMLLLRRRLWAVRGGVQFLHVVKATMFVSFVVIRTRK
jgi:hypothetical protein